MKTIFRHSYLCLFFTFLFLHILICCTGQSTDVVLDSLKSELEDLTDAKQKVELLINIGNRARRTQSIEVAETYIQQASTIAKNIKNQKLIADVLMEEGKILSSKGQHEAGTETFKKALKNYTSINLTIGKLQALNALGIIHKRQGEFIESLGYLEQAIELFDNTTPPGRKAAVYNNLTNVYASTNQFALAYEMAFKALKYFEEAKNNRGVGLICGNISSFYKGRGNKEKALEYCQKSIDILKKENDLKGQINGYGLLSSLYSEQGKHKKAIEILEKQLELANKKGAIEMIFISKITTANEYLLLGNINEANALIESVEKDTSRVSSNYLVKYYLRKADVFQKKKIYLKAIENVNKAYNIGKKTGDFSTLASALPRLHDLYSKINAYEKSYLALLEYQVINDSLNNQSNIEELTTQRMQFDFDKKQETYELEKEGLEYELYVQKLIRLGTLVLIFFIGVITFLIYRYYKRQNELLAKDLENKKTIEVQSEKLKVLYDYKNKLFSNIAHELRTPLTLIANPIKLILQKGNADSDTTKKLQLVDRNIRSLSSTIYQILDLAKRENVELFAEPMQFEVNQLIQFIANDFRSMAQFKSIHFTEPAANISIPIITDGEKLMIIIRNLLSNAFKFTSKNGHVNIQIMDLEDEIAINIQDTGRGISPEKLEKIFDRHFQVNPANLPNEGGMGIGLAICKEYIHLIKGTIKAKSQIEKGSTFTIRFPKKLVESNEINSTASADFNTLIAQNPIVKTVIETENTVVTSNKVSEEISTILIVEDNVDMSNYLNSILSEEHEIHFVQDGQQALKFLENQLPDLIISDYMMPNMNGLELLNQLKNKSKYAGIPVIMLTAQQAIHVKLDALRIGVDDYLTKPFDNRELIARVNNILTNQRIIKVEQQSEQAQIDSPKDKVAPPKMNLEDLAWLAELETIALKYVYNMDFTINQLAEEMSISYSSMFPKIKKMTGLTPNQYITELRFQEALKLLEAKKYGSVKAVSYSVGYKSVKYFSKNFKKRFGKNPSEYLI